MSLFNQLKTLQWKQLQHDEKYHKEICLLTVQRRITHMTLHLSKYSSKIVKSAATEDISALRKSLVDTIIITFSSANIFGHIIGEKYSHDPEATIHSIANELLTLYCNKRYCLLLELAIEISSETGKMCKTVESLDHLESYPFRESLLKSIQSIFELAIAICSHIKINDIESEIGDRLYTVEKKNPYFENLGNYKDGYR